MNIFSSSRGGSARAPRPQGTKHRQAIAASYTSAKEDASVEAGFARVLSSALFALPVTAVVGLILLLIVTAVAYADPDPDRLTAPLSLAALGLTALLGGLVAARRGQGRSLLCGLTLGLLLTLLLLGSSLFFGEEQRNQLTLGFPAPAIWLLRGGVILLSALGGKLGGRRNSQNKHRHRR